MRCPAGGPSRDLHESHSPLVTRTRSRPPEAQAPSSRQREVLGLGPVCHACSLGTGVARGIPGNRLEPARRSPCTCDTCGLPVCPRGAGPPVQQARVRGGLTWGAGAGVGGLARQTCGVACCPQRPGRAPLGLPMCTEDSGPAASYMCAPLAWRAYHVSTRVPCAPRPGRTWSRVAVRQLAGGTAGFQGGFLQVAGSGCPLLWLAGAFGEGDTWREGEGVSRAPGSSCCG